MRPFILPCMSSRLAKSTLVAEIGANCTPLGSALGQHTLWLSPNLLDGDLLNSKRAPSNTSSVVLPFFNSSVRPGSGAARGGAL